MTFSTPNTHHPTPQTPRLAALLPHVTGIWSHIVRNPDHYGQASPSQVPAILRSCVLPHIKVHFDNVDYYNVDNPNDGDNFMNLDVAALAVLVREVWIVCCDRGHCRCGCCPKEGDGGGVAQPQPAEVPILPRPEEE